MYTFVDGGCVDTRSANEYLCKLLNPSYLYAGIIASGVIVFGLIFNLFHLGQLAKISFRKQFDLMRGISALRAPYLIMFCYVSSFAYWALGSTALTESDSNYNDIDHEVGLLEKVGRSMQVYVWAVVFYFLVFAWLRCIVKRRLKKSLEEKLLNAEKKFLAALDAIEDM